MSLVARHLSNKQIAAELRISENTVKFHLGKIFERTGTHTRESLSELAQRYNGNRGASCEMLPIEVA